ncbi:MAG: hypothetical protein R3F04_06870 [Lysobacteraceae bacterium]
MILFLDTEWADVFSVEFQLVSIGLVSLDERYQWYAECDPLPMVVPDFVKRVVYPLLERGACAMSSSLMGESLRAFIDRVAMETGETPTVAYDFWNDRAMFFEAWCGSFGDHAERPPPVQWFDLNSLNPHYANGFERYFAECADERTRRHHALVDARAARAGYLHAIRCLAMGAPDAVVS